MPEEAMEVTNSTNPYIAQVQSSTTSLRYYTTSDDEEPAYHLDNSDDRDELVSSRNSTRSLDSLDTLLMTLPDIVIPDPIRNPLPLQCLAAGALPECLRQEIDVVLKEYTPAMTSPLHNVQQPVGTSSVELRRKKYERSGSIVCKAQDGVVVSIGESVCDGLQESSSNGGDDDDVENRGDVSLHHIKIPRDVTLLPKENVHDLGLGFTLTGGVKCRSCKVLHAIVTSVSAEVADPILAEGVSIKEWNGHNLENETFEEVKVLLNKFIESDSNQVELTVQKCSGNFILRPRQFRAEGGGVFHVFGSWHRRKSHSRNNHIRSNETLNTDSSSLPPPDDHIHKRSSRPQSLELLDTFSNLNSSHSPSRSPTPDDLIKNESEPVEVSIPRLDSDARALSAAMEARPKSPHKINDGRFTPNGMIQISLKYNSEVKDLRINLNKAISQSGKDTQQANDMFINTYLIPDPRGQGVRSIHATGGEDGNYKVSGGTEEFHCYVLSEAELDKSVLRVLFYDSTRGKKNVLRGEVLLSLSDMSVVTLNGQPTWLTVCPLDPNLPLPPDPVHCKQQKNAKSMDQILSKLKNMKTWSRASINLIKSSSSGSGGFVELGPGAGESLRGLSILNRGAKRSTKIKTRSNGPKIMDILESEMGMANHTINEAKLAKLHSILNVLRDDGDERKCDSDSPSEPQLPAQTTNKATAQTTTPEFVSIFDNPKELQRDHNDHNKKPKVGKNNLSKYAIQLGDFPDVSSDSGDNLDGSGNIFRHSMNEQSLAWLSSNNSKKKKNRSKKQSRKDLKQERPRSDSFQKIPRLRESLHGGRVNRISKYTFDDENQLSDKQRSPSDQEGGSRVSKEDDLKFHYKVDTKQGIKDEETSLTNITSPECKCYPVPVEISVHRISVVDVDKARDNENDRIRAHSFDTRMRNQAVPEESELCVKEEEDSYKTRSMSLGDVKHLESANDEVLIVRAPLSSTTTTMSSTVTSTTTTNSTITKQLQQQPPPPENSEQKEHDRNRSSIAANPNQKQVSLENDESVSSLDFKMIRNDLKNRSSVESNAGLSESWEIIREISNQKRKSKRMSQDDMMGSWESVNEGVSPHSDLSKPKYRSMDNLLDDSTESSKSKLSKNEWKNTYLHNPPPHSNTDVHSRMANGVKTVGDAKVELEYNTLNPKHPVLLVKLLDILFLSSKNIPSEFLMKCHLVHNSTGVCILKNKTLVNIKNPTSPGAPLGLSHFQTDIINLSVEVYFLSTGLLFSKKEIGHFYINLDSLELNETTTTYSQWLPILKNVPPPS